MNSVINNINLSEKEFSRFQDIMYKETGIFLPATKKALVLGRLSKRLREFGIPSFNDYLKFVDDPANTDERSLMINILTTNETYFFREKAHFDYLKAEASKTISTGLPFRIWSAACSTGEEPYTIAMVLSDTFPSVKPDITASDINSEVLAKAKKAIYAVERGKEIPENLKKKYCLRGIDENEGKFALVKEIRNAVKFQKINLLEPIPSIGMFDVVFLRNVLIYFDADSKRKVLENIHVKMKKGAKLIMGHSESIMNCSDIFVKEAVSIYSKIG